MDRKPGQRKCSYCWRNFGITEYVRTEAECIFHHTHRLCEVHGGIDCFSGKDDCPGSTPGFDHRTGLATGKAR